MGAGVGAGAGAGAGVTDGEGAVGEGSTPPHVVVAAATAPRNTAITQARGNVLDLITMNSVSLKGKPLHSGRGTSVTTQDAHRYGRASLSPTLYPESAGNRQDPARSATAAIETH